ncbi:unnamed protein product [Phytophthora fragariaefolia]|uniref:Unnamed protein product n=1 Tax=Phytophthora fragariaefolia TaxID=1490495 RepID=A0A9W7D077_9STRA|nr:unnamed protein product [Phytophthora fragariaefolia]
MQNTSAGGVPERIISQSVGSSSATTGPALRGSTPIVSTQPRSASQQRDGRTKLYYQGYSFTNANVSGVVATFVLPRAPTFPNENDIENSEYSSDSDDDAEDVDSDAYISSEISSAHDDSEDMEAENLIETIRSNMRLSDRARI